jgi:hypothetical protein
MGGGAWPFLVGGVICLVYSDNERNPNQSIVVFGLIRRDYVPQVRGRFGR